MKTKIEATIILQGFKPDMAKRYSGQGEPPTPENYTPRIGIKLSTEEVAEVERALNELQFINLSDGKQATVRFHFNKEVE